MNDEPRRGTLPESPEIPERTGFAVLVMVIGLLLAAVAAGYVTFAEPGFVRRFHNAQARFFVGGYYPQLTFIFAFAVFAVPVAGVVALIDNAAEALKRRKR